jgi:hypothetical protein|tara:strand:+ start:4526 stop:4975 length:450 start_codon:yes stop_codon:yes gene_type:complete
MKLKELMQLAYTMGRESVTIGSLPSWEVWWDNGGKERHDAYQGAHRVELPEGTDVEEYAATLADIHRLVVANHSGIAFMLEAMQELQPDEVLDPEGEVFTVTAETHNGTRLAYTVQCLKLKQATDAATAAWGHGGWETLRRRRVQTDGD